MSDLKKIAARMKEQVAADEARRQERTRVQEEERQDAAWSREQEQQVLDLVGAVVDELNAGSPRPLLMKEKIPERRTGRPKRRGAVWRFRTRTLRVHFFEPGELYADPEVPGRMHVLHDRHAVHGGYIKIEEGEEDREGWNLVMVRPNAEIGEWRIVETDFHALNRRVAEYRPFATEARPFANNLACHWDNAMDTFTLTDKPLERDDIEKSLEVLVG